MTHPCSSWPAPPARISETSPTSDRTTCGRWRMPIRSARSVPLTQALELLSIGELMVADAVEGLRLTQDCGQIPSAAVHLGTIATVDALCGDEGRAENCAAQVIALSAQHGLAFAEDLIESAVKAGAPDAAAEALAKLEQWAESSRSQLGRATLDRCRALLSEGSTAAEFYERAFEAEALQGTAVTRARTELLYEEFLRRERRRADASSKEVAGKLLLSPRTVDYHLRKIFTKTGITSRNQLRDLTSGISALEVG